MQVKLFSSGEAEGMKESDFFREQAKECRSAAMNNGRAEDARALRQLARYYEEQAAKVDRPVSKH
jgi:hypothetical protein